MHNDNSNNRRVRAVTSIIAFFLLLAVIISLSYYVYFTSKDDVSNINIKDWVLDLFTKDDAKKSESMAVVAEAKIEENNVLKMGYDLSRYNAFCTYKEILIKCTPNSIMGIDNKGIEVWSQKIDAEKPLLKTNGTDILVADINGYMIYIFNGNKIKWENKIENKIINAEINSQGFVTITHEANGYKAAVSAFDPSGTKMFSRFIADNFVITANMNPSGKGFIVNEVDISGTKAISYLEFFKTFEKPFAGIKSTEIMANIDYMSDGSVFAAGTSKIEYFDIEGKKKWEKEFSKIFSSIICEGKYIVIATDNEDKPSAGGFGNTKILVLDRGGKIISEYLVDDEVKNLKSIDDIIAVNSGREVHFINYKSKLLNKTAFKADVLQVHFFNKDEALVVTRNSVIRMKI